MARPLILDGRNLWDPDRLCRLGFEYHSIGRAPVYPVGRPTPISRVAPKELATSIA